MALVIGSVVAVVIGLAIVNRAKTYFPIVGKIIAA